MRSAVAFISCAMVLALLNFSIVGKERQLESGKVVFLELAPVDPRSLMQVDYMALRFKIANDARPAMDRSESSAGRRSRVISRPRTGVLWPHWTRLPSRRIVAWTTERRLPR